jgi:hypothetical protein
MVRRECVAGVVEYAARLALLPSPTEMLVRGRYIGG